ncbi:alpha/beta hydrolase [Spirillospora sp. NPDC052269]
MAPAPAANAALQGAQATAQGAHATVQGLRDPRPCLNDGAVQPGFTCWKLTVPFDHSGRTPGTLYLQVGAADGPANPKGTLVFLAGGPGQEGVALLQRIAGCMPEVFKQYRLVMLDQRGTGPLGAVNCPAMQAQIGGSAPACGFDPAQDLAELVRRRTPDGGLALFGDVVGYEFIDPTYRNPGPIPGSGLPGDLIGAMHQAVAGDTRKLDAIEAVMNPADGTPASRLSAGLHAATICSDLRFPWGSSATPNGLRQPFVDHVAQTLPPSATWPYTSAVALAQSSVRTCLRWPAEPPNSNPSGRLPALPTLILNGDHDLSTPLEWARQELAVGPAGADLVVVEGAAHSIQSRESGHAGRDAVVEFLLG